LTPITTEEGWRMSDRMAKEKDYTLINYTYVSDALNELDKLINDQAPKSLIQFKYKSLKGWLKNEYSKVTKYDYNEGYILQWYAPMITDIYVNSFDIAKTNSSVSQIKDAVIDGLNYYNYWVGMLGTEITPRMLPDKEETN
jgi:hypothetical protein